MHPACQGKAAGIIDPVYKGGNGSTERLRILPEVTQQVRATGSTL